MESNPTSVTIHVDPTCPFAWITSRWLLEVERQGGPAARCELMSLSVVNEGRDLDPDYRAYNEGAWRPARVAAALLASPDADRWPEFYATFGQRRHVEGIRYDRTNLTRTLAELGLPAALLDAAESADFDDDLRRRTAAAVEPLRGDGGTPILHVDGRAWFGPVLTAIPRGRAALDLWNAVAVLSRTAHFSEIKGARDEGLATS